MPFPPPINEALENYDKKKGPWRRLIGTLFPSTGHQYQAAIRALRRLSEADQTNFLKFNQCFIENEPNCTQESFKVYQALLDYLNTIGKSSSFEPVQQLHASKLLTDNLDKLIHLKDDEFSLLAKLLSQLKKKNLLSQTNFDNTAKYFETTNEHISKKFNDLVKAVEILDMLLTQENFNLLLSNPALVNILTILKANDLLTSNNCCAIFNDGNQYLRIDKAYNSVWLPLNTYLSTLTDLKEKQWRFDQLICLMKEKNPEEKIKNFICRLNSEGTESVKNKSTVKCFTAPPRRSKSRSSLQDLVTLRPQHGTL